MSERPRFSREDYERQARIVTTWADAPGIASPSLAIVLRLAAAMLSEAATRAPTHEQIMAGETLAPTDARGQPLQTGEKP